MRDKPSGGKAKNPGSPVAAYERSKRSKTYGPTGGAQPRPTRGGGSMVADKKKAAARAAGSPTAAAERQKRATTYGPTGGALPRPTRVAGRGAKDVPRPERGAGRGADDRPRPVRGAGRSNPKPKTEQQMIAEQKTLKAKLRGVDYEGLGRLMQAKGYGAAGRKAANTGRKTLPKTK